MTGANLISRVFSFLPLAALLVLLSCGVMADQVSNFAQQSANTYCAYSGFQSSKYCPPLRPAAAEKENFPARTTAAGTTVLQAVIGLGYDPVAKQIGLPVTASSYAAGRTWVNSQGAKFAVPDQVSIQLGNVATAVNKAYHFTDYEDYFNQAIDLVDGNCLGGMFTSSQDIQTMYNQHFVGSKSLTVSQEYHELFTLSFQGAYALDPVALAAINWLPAVYNQALYFEFIQYWGTHYITQSTFGGMAEVIVETAECVNNLLNAQLVEQYAIYDTINTLHPGTIPASKYDSRYTISRKVSSIDMVGGNPELATVAQWAQRIASFELDPVNLYFTYAPISNLIADATRKANMVRAVQEYIAQGGAKNANQKSAIDALDAAAFKQPQPIYHLEFVAETIETSPPGCVGQSSSEISSSTHQPICYWAPQVFMAERAILSPGQSIVSETNSKLPAFCSRDATTGLVSANCNAWGYGFSGPVKNGCSSCIRAGTGINTAAEKIPPQYMWCCVGINAAEVKYTAQYGKPGSVISFTCPPI